MISMTFEELEKVGNEKINLGWFLDSMIYKGHLYFKDSAATYKYEEQDDSSVVIGPETLFNEMREDQRRQWSDAHEGRPLASTLDCWHDWKGYVGLVQVYSYCNKCGVKKD